MAQALVRETRRIGVWTEKTRRDLVASHDFREVVRSLSILLVASCQSCRLAAGAGCVEQEKKMDTARQWMGPLLTLTATG